MVAVSIAVKGQVGMGEGVFRPEAEAGRDVASESVSGLGEERVVDAAKVEGVDEAGGSQ